MSNLINENELSESTELIPLGSDIANNQRYLAIPTITNGSMIKLRINSENQIALSPFDPFEEELETVSLNDIIFSDLHKGDSVLDDTYKYYLDEDDTEIIKNLADNTGVDFLEFLSFIVNFLEEHPVISYETKNKNLETCIKYRNIEPKEVVNILQRLPYTPEVIFNTLCNASNDEIDKLFSMTESDSIIETFEKMM